MLIQWFLIMGFVVLEVWAVVLQSLVGVAFPLNASVNWKDFDIVIDKHLVSFVLIPMAKLISFLLTL